MYELTKERIEQLPDTIFFSVGSGTVGYPPCEPFYRWLSSVLQPIFYDKEWLAKQDITVVEEPAANHLPRICKQGVVFKRVFLFTRERGI